MWAAVTCKTMTKAGAGNGPLASLASDARCPKHESGFAILQLGWQQHVRVAVG